MTFANDARTNPGPNHTPVVLVGTHRLWGYSSTFDATALHQRIFGFLVQMAAPVVKEYHGDLFLDAEWLRDTVSGPCTFLYCVRYSGTNLGLLAPVTYESLTYDAVLYRVTLTEKSGVWSLVIDVVGSRPLRPTPPAHSADALGLNPV